MKSPFNDYDERGYRYSGGRKFSKIEDEAILRNLRFRWPSELKNISDAVLVTEYHEFALSSMFGDNDERFLEWIKEADL